MTNISLPDLCIVVPVYNEELAIRPFLDAVVPIVERLGSWRIVFIDDGSQDGTWNEVVAAKERCERVEGIRFSRNFGKEAAMSAGLDVADGHCVIVMDVDLQDPPELIPKMITEWKGGADVVYAARRSRATDTWLKRESARAFYRAFNGLSSIPIPADAGDFRLLDQRVVRVLRLLPERSRFMKGLFAWIGFRVASVPYDRPTRSAGNSKFPFWTLWAFALDGLFNFTSKPLRVWTYVGVPIVAVGLVFAAIVIFQAIFLRNGVPGYASMTTLLIFFSGVQIVGIGILGEYLSRVFTESKWRPLYVIKSATTAPTALTIQSVASRRPEILTFGALVEGRIDGSH